MESRLNDKRILSIESVIRDRGFLENIRGGVLEDLLGLEDTFSSPWPRRSSPWPRPRSLRSSKIDMSSAQGQHYFFEQLKFCWKAPKTSRKICEYLFCFPQLEHWRRQGARAPPQSKFRQWQKCAKKPHCFFSFSFFQHFSCTTVTNNNIKDQGRRAPLNSIFAHQFKCITRVK